MVCALASVVACDKKDTAGTAAGSAVAPPVSAPKLSPDLVSKAQDRHFAVFEIAREAEAVDPASWPTGDVPGLDFTRETGNTVVVLRKPLGAQEEILMKAPKFRLLRIEDDAYAVSGYASGTSLPEGESAAAYQESRYWPALELMKRAKYALYLTAELQRPDLGYGDSFTAGIVKGKGVLYAIDPPKLLGGVEFLGTNSESVKVNKANTEEKEKLVLDLENNARKALEKAIVARFPSAKAPMW